jgi:hypothetical protein
LRSSPRHVTGVKAPAKAAAESRSARTSEARINCYTPDPKMFRIL